VWGRQQDARDANRVARFTPTRVGTTRPAPAAPGHKPVHPHACGDDSSPTSPAWRRPRFTPTRVGTTAIETTSPVPAPVHPHACGDDAISYNRLNTNGRFTPTRVGTTDISQVSPLHLCGSPPRVWGRLFPGLGKFRKSRFTPTRVGTTYSYPPLRSIRSVHPHACGDDYIDGSHKAADVGSPPRVWGRLGRGCFASPHIRFTPTRVGTTGLEDPERAS